MLNLRARMLKRGIISGMLSDTSDDNRWLSIWKGIKSYALSVKHFFLGRTSNPGPEMTSGDNFYDHSLIKSYGINRVFPTPSYIPSENFSVVLLDVLKNEFGDRLAEIAEYKFTHTSTRTSLVDLELSLKSAPGCKQD